MEEMSPFEAHRRLVRYGILTVDQIESFKCGSEHFSDIATEVLQLAAIVLPEKFPHQAIQNKIPV